MALSPAHELTQAIKTEAHRLGFVLAGVTHPGTPPHFPQYQAWVDAGQHAGMAYLATERALSMRRDPAGLLPGCRSILVLGIPYYSPASIAPSPGSQYGRVAAYAWGDDYHVVLPTRMRTLGEYITHLCGADTTLKEYTDTAPVLERDLAQRAGLGWIGKNSCLINPRMGSYFFLAEIFLNVALAEDPPYQRDGCGSCQKCLQTCPTGCIQPNHTLDARRCIAYLTIENKADISEELRSQLGDWVFGCDLCQVVCPWNHRPFSTQGDAAFAPRAGVAYPNLSEDLQLSPETFKRRFTNSPILRAHRHGYLRNLAAAADNAGDIASIPALEKLALNEDNPLVHTAVSQALGHLRMIKS